MIKIKLPAIHFDLLEFFAGPRFERKRMMFNHGIYGFEISDKGNHLKIRHAECIPMSFQQGVIARIA